MRFHFISTTADARLWIWAIVTVDYRALRQYFVQKAGCGADTRNDLNRHRATGQKTGAPREVHFEHPRPQQWHEHCKVFDARRSISTSRSTPLLIVKRDAARDAGARSDAFTDLRRMRSVVWNADSPSHQSVVDARALTRVRQVLLRGEPVLDEGRIKMGTSPSSLQRRLREQNLTFTQLVDKVRCELATHYLQQQQLPISEWRCCWGILKSCFSRAFRRWFGVSPRQWRQTAVS